MKTGTDISLAECRASGYAIITHYGKKIFPNRFYNLEIDGRNFNVTYSDLYEMAHNDEFKSYCDWKNCPYPSPDENIRPVEMASLFQNLISFFGTDDF